MLHALVAESGMVEEACGIGSRRVSAARECARRA
jgi:hypothetical protein